MSVNEMLLLAKIFLAAMICLALLAVFMFFKLDIRKAWGIVTGARSTGYAKNRSNTMVPRPGTRELISQQKVQVKDENATAILQPELIPVNHADEYGPTTVLDREEYAETTLLKHETATTGKMEMLVDITYIHTEVVI